MRVVSIRPRQTLKKGTCEIVQKRTNLWILRGTPPLILLRMWPILNRYMARIAVCRLNMTTPILA